MIGGRIVVVVVVVVLLLTGLNINTNKISWKLTKKETKVLKPCSLSTVRLNFKSDL